MNRAIVHPGFYATLRLALLVVISFSTSVVLAQDEKWGDGELENVEVEIVRERQITLPKASRNFEKVPPRPVEPIQPEITYDFRNLNFSLPDYQPSLRPLKLKQEDLTKIYGNWISAGYGNYASPYLEGWVTSKRDKNRFVGAHLFHESFGKGPIDGKNSASSITDMRIFGKAFTKTLTSGGYLNYENKGTYFYGYPQGTEVDRDSTRQQYSIFALGADITNTQSGDFNFRLNGDFSYLTDHYKAVESMVNLGYQSSYVISPTSKVILGGDYSLISRKDSLVEAKPRNLLRIKPAFQFQPMDLLTLSIGANVAMENDTIQSKDLHIYPNFNAAYALTPSVNAYASLTGDMDKVSLHSISAENLWVNSNIAIFHTNRSAELTAGLKGKLGRKFAFDAGFSAANLKDWYFYQNDSVNYSKFDVIYDRGNTKRVNFFGEMGFNQGEGVKLLLRGDYFAYSTDEVTSAWHRPTYRVKFNSSFNIYSKVVLNVDFIGQGGMKAYDAATSKVSTLKPALDLSVKADYYVSRQVSIFMKLNNLLSSQYPLYLNYPVRGLQAKAGLTWSF